MNNDYYKKRIVRILDYFCESDLEILNKFGINIEDRNYTEYEFAIIEEELFIYDCSENNFFSERNKKILFDKKIKEAEFMKLLEKLNKISSEYRF